MAQSSYWFSSPDGSNQPYVYVADQNGRQQPVGVALDDVFTAPPGTLPTAAPFALTAGTKPFAYQVSVDASIWTFGTDPIRPTVRAAFDGFLQQLDAAGLKGGRLHQIRGWLAQVLPQTFAESLYFRYGFDPAQRVVELSPGMRLRIDFQAHQAVDPGSSALNGFVGSGRSTVEIGQATGAQGGLVLGFDPFLAQLGGMNVAGSPGAGGVVDLETPAYQQPYWRLHYPASYPAAGSTGFAGTQQNPVLVGAPTRALLEAASAQYLSDGTVPGSPTVALWLRGRATPVPEIPVLVQGDIAWTTLGTTLRRLVEGFTPVPWVNGKVGVPAQLLTRVLSPLTGSTSSPLGWQLLTGQTLAHVALDSAFFTYGPTLDSLDMPLLGGDSVSLPTTG